MKMYVQKNAMSLPQLIVFILVLGGLLVAGFFLTMALLPLILVFIAYIWFKVRKARKAFQERYDQMQQERYNQEENAQAYYVDAKDYEYSESSSNSSQNEQATPLKYRNTGKQKDETIIYDIEPQDYTIEEKK